MRDAAAGVFVAATMVLLSGCASDEGGFGLPTLDAQDAEAAIASGAAVARSVTGALEVEANGCFTWTGDADEDGTWIVWPADAEQDADVVVLGSGRRVADGDALDAVGAVVELDDLPDGTNPDSYFGSFGGFCDAAERGVLVLTEARAD